MDGQRFDALARLVAVRSSRRSILGAAASALTTGILRAAPAAAIACRGAGQLCSKNANCCSDLCVQDADNRRRCHCPDKTDICGDVCIDPATGYLADPRNCGGCGVRCRSGVCLSGVCGKALGEACAAGGECGSGFCVDGLCCDRACDGQCQTCAKQGRCRIVTGAPVAGRAACLGTGACTGACDGQHPACVYPGGKTTCDDSTCVDGTQTDYACDGAGNCAAATTDCGLYVCGADACLTTCGDDGDCLKVAFCDGGICTGDLPNGQPCDRRAECQSGHCVDGVCCDSASCPACHACDVGGNLGTCVAVADETTCGTDRVCCAGVCCAPGAACDGDTCAATCLAIGEACRFTDDCCPGEFTTCNEESATFEDRCCNTLGGPCFVDEGSIGQSPFGCCTLYFGSPVRGSQVFCGPSDQAGPGTCGGPGAFCGTTDEICVSGVCCEFYCCDTGQACVDGVCKKGAGEACTDAEICASGLCCGGQCVDRNEEHCTSCTDGCPPNHSCGSDGCKLAIGQSCSDGTDCVTGFCYSNVCCDECGGQCGQPRPKGTPCSGGHCCFGVCQATQPPDPYSCGVCGDEICPVGDICASNHECTCTQSSTVDTSAGCHVVQHSCRDAAGLCVTSTEGDLFCEWVAQSDCSRTCTTSADCPNSTICTGSGTNISCSSDWVCTPTTCCPSKICVIALPNGRLA
ncbi:MAG TPA: hypothetical protein VH482_12370 [Thermomicrobiales bacterium]|jgi:hypothetical protein